MISNRAFWWFAEVLTDRFADDEEVVYQVEVAEAVHGVSLDRLYKDDPQVAMRLRRAFRTVAEEIRDGQQEVEYSCESEEKFRALFGNLVEILDRWDVSREN
jgi:hypothetical protein